jgi:hypothetical protein
MSQFKPKRVSGAELAAQLSPATANLPTTSPAMTPNPATTVSGGAERQRPPPVVQVNFKASVRFADLIAREAEKAGSTRRLFARLMRDAGFEVPESDVNPPDNRRKRGLDA